MEFTPHRDYRQGKRKKMQWREGGEEKEGCGGGP
jgi:hypothetical protein